MEKQSSGVLYMIPSPIAEGDAMNVLPERVRSVVASLDYFIAEDLRTVRRFISSLATGRSIGDLFFAECSEHTPQDQMERLIAPLLEGHDTGLVSEAGLPGVADPGAGVVAACHRHGIRVVPLSGPSSLMMALMASGQNGQSFAFNGYLPVKPQQRAQALRRLERRSVTECQSQIFIETPYRNSRMLEDILGTCAPSTALTVAADISGPDETVITDTVAGWRERPAGLIPRKPAVFIIGQPYGTVAAAKESRTKYSRRYDQH